MSEKDVEDLRWGLHLTKLDFIALSFVRSAKDVEDVRRVMHEEGVLLPVIAKIEKPQAIDNLDEVIKTLQYIARLIEIVHDRRLGDLDAQPSGIALDACQRLSQRVGDREVLQVPRREIDLDPYVKPLRSPRGTLTQRLLQDPDRDGTDETGMLGKADELPREDRPARRVLPAHQRFHACKPAITRVDDRLEMQNQVVVLHRPPQLTHQGVPLFTVRIVFGDVEREAAPRALRPVHRDVGTLYQQFDRLSVVWIESDADARIGLEVDAVHVVPLGEHRA